MELKNTPKRNFVQLFEWLHNNMDFEEIDRMRAWEVYFSALKWYETNIANGNYVQLDDNDFECLLALQSGSKNNEELSAIIGLSCPAMNPKMHKLASRGLVIVYIEENNKRKRKTYYKLSPYGAKYLQDIVLVDLNKKI